MFTKKHKATIAAAVMVPALLLGACGKKSDSDGGTSNAKADTAVSGKIVVSGSSTVEPISAAVREEFIAQNDKVDIKVDGPGTGDGFKLFCEGDTDISNASRPIKDEEATACKDKGIEFIELKIGIDGLSVITPSSDKIKCLSFEDLYALIGPESEGFDTWQAAQPLAKELGSKTTLPDENLVITAPCAESGTYDSFLEIAIKGISETRAEEGKITEDQIGTSRPDYSASPDDNAILEGVAGDPGGLGWVGFAFADQADGVNLVPVAKEAGGDCVAPTPETIQDGSYPLSRSLYIYVNAAKAKSNKALASFVDFYLEGLDGFVEGADYIPLKDDAPTNKVWTDRTTGTN